MDDERYKQLMIDVGMPNSRSLLQALKQVANEVGQEQVRQLDNLKELLSAIKIDDRGLFADMPTDKWMDKRKELLK